MFLQNVSNVAMAWYILKTQYEMANQTQILNLENQLAKRDYAPRKAIDTFLAWVKNLYDHLAIVGV